ncbi:Sesquithujene synthase A [Dichanthelium oligosanthes]|uniref:Sesquithujene synthase A n=1 Tax=Dichanthelium oligosanthes TaxID=888268 RepID=A0A1E5UQC9_9POAL|nr:Sesquithujene synthase A [Dichanthelium oligosanthes]
MASPPALHSSNAEELRKATTFHPSLWGDFFLTYQPPTAPRRTSMKERAQVLREDVRKIVVKGSRELPETLNLIIALQRLGLDSYYESEIDELLHGVYNSDYNDKDLNLASLRFYLLRKNGYDVSSDVFLNFRTKDGNFVDADTRSLLSLYNAAYLRTREDKVLDEAISYTTRCLQDALQHSEPPLATEVSSFLDIPLFKKVGIMEARNYIPIYENESTRNEAILEFAKLNFNLQQLVFCEEVKECTMWWKDIHAKSKLSFVRDRIVELYFWMNSACYYPSYSLSRIVLTKIVAIITILDDIFDTYGTTEECMQIAEAIYRWDESAVSLLPEYVKGFYLCLLETFKSFEDELGPEKSYRVFYLKEKASTLFDLIT